MALLLAEFAGSPLVQKLRTGDDCFNQVAEALAVCVETRAHLRDCGFVGQLKSSTQTVGKQFTAKVVQKVILPADAQMLAQPLEPGPLRPAGERGPRGQAVAGRAGRMTAIAKCRFELLCW